MKTLIVGGGSIGRRHAATAKGLGWQTGLVEIDSERARQVAQETGVAETFSSLEDGIAWGPEAAIIATPHVHHASQAKLCAAAGMDLLIEKPISHSLREADELIAMLGQSDGRAFVVCNMRFHPAVQAIAENVDRLGTVYYAQSHYGDYLPSFRPERDYRKLYCAKRSEGGGVVLDAVIHELDLLMWMLGPVKRLQGVAAKLSNLEMDAEDFSTITLEHEAGPRSVITFDYFRRWRRRGLELVGEKGQIIWQSEGKAPERCEVRLYDGESGTWHALYQSDDVDNGLMFTACLRAFEDACSGKGAALQTAEDARARLDVALRARDNTAWN